jgi:hypothetical protein
MIEPIRRRKGVKRVNRPRKARTFQRNFHSPEFVAFTRRQPCALCHEAPRKWWNREAWGNDCAHTKARGMGGAGGDWRYVVPCCPACHDAGRPNGEHALAREHQKRWEASHECSLWNARAA